MLFYAPGLDPFLEELEKNADRVWYFDKGPRASPKLISKEYPKGREEPDHLGGVLMRQSWSMVAQVSFLHLYLIHTFIGVKMVFCYLFPAKLLILTRSKEVSWQESLRSY